MLHLTQTNNCCHFSFGLEIAADGSIFGTCPETMKSELILTGRNAQSKNIKTFADAKSYMISTYPSMRYCKFVNLGCSK